MRNRDKREAELRAAGFPPPPDLVPHDAASQARLARQAHAEVEDELAPSGWRKWLPKRKILFGLATYAILTAAKLAGVELPDEVVDEAAAFVVAYLVEENPDTTWLEKLKDVLGRISGSDRVDDSLSE